MKSRTASTIFLLFLIAFLAKPLFAVKPSTVSHDALNIDVSEVKYQYTSDVNVEIADILDNPEENDKKPYLNTIAKITVIGLLIGVLLIGIGIIAYVSSSDDDLLLISTAGGILYLLSTIVAIPVLIGVLMREKRRKRKAK